MQRRAQTILLALGFSLAACSSVYTEIDEHQCPSGGTTLTYANFGAEFMQSYCQYCHGSNAMNREGAPGEFIFDTQEQVIRHKDRIFVRSAGENDSMPPGPEDPPLEERNKLAEWLSCGAP